MDRADFFNQLNLDCGSLSRKQAQDWAGRLRLVHPGTTVPDSQVVCANLWSLVKGCEARAEARLRRFDGEYRLVFVSCNPLCNEEGNIVKLVRVIIKHGT